MKRYVFLVGVPLVVLGLMMVLGQVTIADSRLQFEPNNWPSNTPKYFQTGTGPPNQTDLSISKADTPDPASVGAPLTYTIAISNEGFVDSAGVVLVDALPLSVDFASASPSQGNCVRAIFVVICDLNTIASGVTATVTIVVTPTESTTIINTAAVSSTVPNQDSNPENNKAIEETLINPSQGPMSASLYLPLIIKQ